MALVGEFPLIARVVARAGTARLADVGPGDDAAVVRTPDGRVVVCTDVLVEGRHFRRDWSSGRDVGHKAAAANLADVAAMGAVPTALLVGLACPADTPVGWLEEVAEGMAAECAPSGAAVVGGDTSASAPDSAAVVLSVTALGDLEGRPPVLRSGARPGDVVALAGRLGWSAAGYALFRAGAVAGAGDGPAALVVRAHRRPEPPYGAGPAGARAGATSMCDVSDGLLADAGHLAAASGVVLDLDRAALAGPGAGPPLAAVAAALGVDPLGWVLTGGEDHALVGTFPPGARLPEGWSVVGRVVDGAPGVLLDGVAAEQVARELQPGGAAAGDTVGRGTGHEHFR
ncbi:thiamine-phosphate kinase [Modestobacter sp. I12A-02628]|uniref:Thiamine-monophosphate kinase n=1 Tax=Goekera deserti TaxID=2497753 RepID=A0A7K3WH69_9ACTN|nr:thiamine-phosphate kinase [Goekera deserti]NDI50189.1 thiamine-phosphate kinase [Goekera deserti]NEL55757.1 thiamine-phosphate kinase [Goekera deserti]